MPVNLSVIENSLSSSSNKCTTVPFASTSAQAMRYYLTCTVCLSIYYHLGVNSKAHTIRTPITSLSLFCCEQLKIRFFISVSALYFFRHILLQFSLSILFPSFIITILLVLPYYDSIPSLTFCLSPVFKRLDM